MMTVKSTHTLQEDFNRLFQWSEKWQMLSNQSKRKYLHIGQANGKELYKMHNTVLLKTLKENDLGATISADCAACNHNTRLANTLQSPPLPLPVLLLAKRQAVNSDAVIFLVTYIKFVVSFDIPVEELDHESMEDLFGEGIKIISEN